MLHNSEAVKLLDSLGVDVLMLYDMADHIYEEQFVENEKETLSFHDLLKVIFKFRGNRPATVKDLVHTRQILTDALARKTDLLQEYDIKKERSHKERQSKRLSQGQIEANVNGTSKEREIQERENEESE